MSDRALEYMDKILFNEKIYKIWDGLIENGGECNEDDSLSMMAASQYNKYLQPGKKTGRPMESLKPAEQGYQVPEPWNGNLEKADILFLSSNPGINVFEKFPRYTGRDKACAPVFLSLHFLQQEGILLPACELHGIAAAVTCRIYSGPAVKGIHDKARIICKHGGFHNVVQSLCFYECILYERGTVLIRREFKSELLRQDYLNSGFYQSLHLALLMI